MAKQVQQTRTPAKAKVVKPANPKSKVVVKRQPAVAQKVAATAEIRQTGTYRVFLPLGGYGSLSRNKGTFRAFTIASLVAAGLLALTKDSVTKRAEGGPASLLKKLVGASAFQHWKNNDRLSVSGGIANLTDKGMLEVEESLKGATEGYNTDLPTIKQIHDALLKGGEHQIGDTKLRLESTPVVVSAFA